MLILNKKRLKGMKKLEYETKKIFLTNVTFIAVIAVLVYITFKFMLSLLLPFIIAMVLAYAMERPARYLKRKLHFSETAMRCTFLVFIYLLVVGGLTVILLILITNADKILIALTSRFEGENNIISRVSGLLSKTVSNFPEPFRDTFKKILDNLPSRLAAFLTDLISGVLSAVARFLPPFLVSSLVTVVASFYIAKDYKRLIKFIKNLLGVNKYKFLNEIKEILTSSVLKLVKGYLIIALITFLEVLLGFLILSVENAFLWALLASLLDMLPIIGAGTVLLPIATFSFVKGELFTGVGILILYLAITIIRHFIEPKIMGKTLSINPLFMLIAIFVGLKIGGFGGMIIFPITLIVIFNYYKRRIENEKTAIS